MFPQVVVSTCGKTVLEVSLICGIENNLLKRPCWWWGYQSFITGSQ